MLANMKELFRWLAVCAGVLVLAACGTTRSAVVVEPASGHGGGSVRPDHARGHVAPGGSYTVVHGDTLYSIAFRNGVDFRDLAQWNGIAVPYTIWPGQTLRLSPPASGAKPAARVVAATPSPHAAPGATTVARSSSTAGAAPVFEPAPTPAPAAPATAPVAAASASHATPAAPSPVSSPAHGGSAAMPSVAATTVVPVAGETAAKPPAPAPVPPAAVPSGATRAAGGVAWRWPADGKLIKGYQSGDAIPGIELTGKSGDPVRAAADGVVVYSGNGLVGYGELIIIKHNDSFLSAYGHNRQRLVKEGQRVSAGQQIAAMGDTGAARVELQFQIRRDGNPVNPLDYLPAR
ncbi:peptidoglycan DD-metalloendopeptidase family protein [Frateuria defendens]|uniref:peptidoglycan DD-metalloendopeptidase family protein n=1 Tax=Frateuria defendens TaxID=2219559 RepID=UPI00066FBB6A|nr:peptidoglycan DD-metalloendopeptidase family protein [Frateuria defendens]